MNLWTAEQTVKAVIQETTPAGALRLSQERMELLVEQQALQFLEEIQQIQELNRTASVHREEILEVAKNTALKHLQERIPAALKAALAQD